MNSIINKSRILKMIPSDHEAFKLSFPDFDIKKIEFSFEEKKVKIFIDGAWLDIDGGIELGKGILYFNDWENFSINRFDPYTEKWANMNESELELLKDICEVKFSDSKVCLYGFGKQIKTLS